MRLGSPLTALALAGPLLVAVPSRAPGAETQGTALAEVGSGVDSNPDRVLGAPGQADAFASALARGSLAVKGDRYGVTAQLTEAGRLYLAATGATALGSRLEASGSYAVADRLTLGGALLASDLTERGHQLDQNLLDGIATVAWSAGAWRLHGGAGWNLFSPRAAPLRPFLASGPRTVLGASWTFTAGESLGLAWDFAAPTYPRWQDFAGTTRDDRTHTLSAEWVHRGAFLAAAGYAYAWNRSSAPGGAYERHRVQARLATFVVGDLALAARAALQWSSYPDPLYLAQQILLSDGQQNLDQVEARLTHPLTDALEVVVGCALYRAEATVGPGQSPSFTRVVASVGVAWRGEGYWSSMTGTP